MTDAADLARWERLCALLDDDPELWPSVQATLEDPPADPWTALLDGLDDAGALAYLDHDDQGSELAEALAGVPRVRDARLDLGRVTDTDGDVARAVQVADEVLAPAGLCLVHLAEDSDAYPLVAVRSVDRAEIERVVAELGHSTTLG
ncbi:hypothetical protein SAMN03159343_1348 [Klenkia marina]|uniref:DUF6630 domain-containing protein n=1 Tax=Klenkia marina TaxID=1960309 RepID=A0A1G4XS91_9ACTN|nr:hypothetical protein [Klenkia marina]SCX44062.1 hypothetical protein SAMN03159343_1348 [Klenkia marina]